jgi:signal transduction histidine kinase
MSEVSKRTQSESPIRHEQNATSATKAELEPLRDRTDIGLEKERAKTDLIIERDLGENGAHAEGESPRIDADKPASPLRTNLAEFERALVDRGRERERRLAGLTKEPERQQPGTDAAPVEYEPPPGSDKTLGRERAQTDERLRQEREETDEVVDAAGVRLLREEAAHVLSKKALAYRDEILALVGHELRNPLTAIGLRAQELLEPPPGDQTALAARLAAHEIAEDIQAACDQMARIVAELLDAALADMGRLNITVARGDAVRLVHDAMAASAPMLRKQGLSVKVVEPAEPLFAWFDRARLLQVFANLFGNALKFTAPGGTITVSVAKVGAELRFCVADSGRGIPPEDLLHVFERFWQLGKGERRGIGLGLYICKSIVEAHGGRIWVSSDVGAGSRFFFTLPEAT